MENNDNASLIQEIRLLKKQIESLTQENSEYEAVENFIMKKLKQNCIYEEVLKAHYRQGHVDENGAWVDEDEE